MVTNHPDYNHRMCLFWAIWWPWRASHFAFYWLPPKRIHGHLQDPGINSSSKALFPDVKRKRKGKYFLNECIRKKISVQRSWRISWICKWARRALSDKHSVLSCFARAPGSGQFRNLLPVPQLRPSLGYRGKHTAEKLLKSTLLCCFILRIPDNAILLQLLIRYFQKSNH